MNVQVSAHVAAARARYVPVLRHGVGVSTLILIGYWCSETEPHWPDPVAWIDLDWDELEREQVADYLDAGIVPWASAGLSPCRVCGKRNGSAERTDGVYVWPEGLYVRDHGVRLPDRVLDHIRERWSELEFGAVVVDDSWWRTLGHRD